MPGASNGNSPVAAVDLGSNSFHLQVGRVVGGQIYPLDTLREVVRLGAGLTSEKRIDALKEEFFQAAAHDLRAPLFAVQGYLRLLKKSIEPDDRQKNWLEAIDQSCERLTALVKDALDAARIEHGLELAIVGMDELNPVGPGGEILRSNRKGLRIAVESDRARRPGLENGLHMAPEADGAIHKHASALRCQILEHFPRQNRFVLKWRHILGGRVAAATTMLGA
jgi:signal transduction histidine kinase